MNTLLQIIIHVIFPIFFVMGLGAFLHKKFIFDLNTLSKIATFLLLPAVAFVNVYQSEISVEFISQIISFLILQSFLLMILCELAARWLQLDRSLAATFKNTIVLNNSGNFGIPVSQLVFQGNPLGMSIQVFVMIFQNILTFTYGLFNSVSAKEKSLKAMVELLKVPIIYALALGLILNFLDYELPSFLLNPISSISNAFLAIALLTMGAQIAALKVYHISFLLFCSISGRLILSPLLAWIIISLLGLEGTMAQALFIASSFPSSRNSALFALEYNNHPDFAAQVVFITTVASSITVSVVVFLSGILF